METDLFPDTSSEGRFPIDKGAGPGGWGGAAIRLCSPRRPGWMDKTFFLIFKNFYFEREQASGGEGQRERERESKTGFPQPPLIMEPDVGLDPMTLGS